MMNTRDGTDLKFRLEFPQFRTLRQGFMMAMLNTPLSFSAQFGLGLWGMCAFATSTVCQVLPLACPHHLEACHQCACITYG